MGATSPKFRMELPDLSVLFCL
ncbi:hypothetical protein J007_00170 [Cryptococcus neoformans]|nr:hypothetical protein J007_00170 [Cryptococcus neoformans var. grubii]